MNQQNHSSGIEVADWGRNTVQTIKQSWYDEFVTQLVFLFHPKLCCLVGRFVGIAVLLIIKGQKAGRGRR